MMRSLPNTLLRAGLPRTAFLTEIISELSGPRWAPQIVVLLDDETHVLSVNRSLAGTSFENISDSATQCVHDQLHPDCDGKCRFNEMWSKAWAGLQKRDSIEWELDDPKLQRLLRLNLSKTPAAQTVEQDRRKRHMQLTITDITKYRREYESLVEQQQALIRLLMAQGLKNSQSGDDMFDESGDTGNRLMAGYVKTERSLSRQLIQAREIERKRIAAELHDGIAQAIGAVKYRIETGVAQVTGQNPDLDLGIFDEAVDEIKNLVDEVRRISSNLSPSMLEDFGIHVALEWLCKEFKVQNKELSVDSEVRVDEGDTPESIRIAIYRVVQEALNNIGKHASATKVEISLKSAAGGIRLVVSDNGIGFDSQQARRGYDGQSGLGFISMRERVEATDGKFTMQSAPDNGVEITAVWDAKALQISQSQSHSS
jgi:signal transduction histidine kinase